MSVFISYAREDRVFAARISKEFDDAGVSHWIDTKSISPGEDWKRSIKLGLKEADLVMILISSNSISKRGFVQREIKEALDLLKEMPEGETYIIPVRIDDCEPSDLALRDLNYYDLFPNLERGLFNLVEHIKSITRQEKDAQNPERQVGALGEQTVLMPYKSFGDVVRVFLAQFHKDFLGNSSVAYYITLKTASAGVELPLSIRKKFPETVSIVLQNQYLNLRTTPEEIKVDLWFYGEKHSVVIPYESIISIASPQLELTISRDPSGGIGHFHQVEGYKRRISELEAMLGS